ncbi:probable G-protein coupled receptor No9 [Dermacentor andersoni]|uniref:octopamine receptor in mushroom bodies n=1 Tax=Dermacentor variabilis TaxID=34621 RepID=UPI0021550571|nr:probable G-protein coupled receptor No9 [Dermacentor andersoni]
MNETCLSSVPPDKLYEPVTVALFLVLGFINVLVIFGNLLVMVAVLASTKLRTVTNYFVVSLAVADLSVGLVVLPYSIALEVLEVWLFGHTWCQIWLAVDVWLCTSSILNLCAISVDRYLAITRPVRYRSLMSSRRAKLLIVAVWVIAFVICFPPLVGWNDGTQNSVPYHGLNETSHNLSIVADEPLPLCESAQCVLINNKGYVIYSALGSFYIPMLFMLFFNYRIYRAAIQTGRALERGFITTKSGKIKGRTQDQRLTLRVHRGNDSAMNAKRGSEHLGAETCIDGIVTGRRRPGLKKSRDEPSASARSSASKARQQSDQRATRSAPPSFKSNRGSARNSGHNGTSGGGSKSSRSSKRSQRWQAKRFRTEAKATKTVGTIVGGFICCWLPFFTVYLVRAFCEHCIPNLLFSVFFWLGYCNSAINPLIYALVSKDFRMAFKRILCRCRLKEGGVSSLIKQIHMLTVLDDAPPDNAESP